MSEEIKEILDKLKDSNWYDELDLTGTRWIELTWKETHLLLNYITSLQQKIEQLEKENKELKEENKHIFQNVNDDELLISNAMNYAEVQRLNNIINELEKYTSENIEVLENRLNSPFCNFEKVTKELLIFQNYLDKLKELKDSN